MGYFDIVRRAAAQEDPAAKQKCYTKADGTQFCLTHQGSKHNTTDVHEANGVNDFSSDQSGHSHDHIAGSVHGQNVSQPFHPANGPQGPKDGSVVFEGNKDHSDSLTNDEHDDHNTGEQDGHTEFNDEDKQDLKAAGQEKDGSKTNSDTYHYDNDRFMSDSKVKNGTEDLTFTSNDDERDHWQVDTTPPRPTGVTGRPGAGRPVGGNTHVSVDSAKDHDYQQESHSGASVYDFHSEDDETDSSSIHISGDNAWKEFMDARKNGQQGWKFPNIEHVGHHSRSLDGQVNGHEIHAAEVADFAGHGNELAIVPANPAVAEVMIVQRDVDYRTLHAVDCVAFALAVLFTLGWLLVFSTWVYRRCARLARERRALEPLEQFAGPVDIATEKQEMYEDSKAV